MPNLADIVEMAEALESKAVLVASERCVAVRNRHSSCKKCVQACPVDAVSVGGNEVSLDSGACVACGACTTVCPTEALIPLDPARRRLGRVHRCGNGGGRRHGGVRVRPHCGRRLGDPDKHATVPCLARMEESVLLALAARGVQDVVLVDGNCATCKYRACVPGIEATVESANTLLATQGSDVRVRRASAFPDEVLAPDAQKSFAASRRGLFTWGGRHGQVGRQNGRREDGGEGAQRRRPEEGDAARPPAHGRRRASAFRGQAAHERARLHGRAGGKRRSHAGNAAVRFGGDRRRKVFVLLHVHRVLPNGGYTRSRVRSPRTARGLTWNSRRPIASSATCARTRA